MSEVPLYAVDWLDVYQCAIDSMYQRAINIMIRNEIEVDPFRNLGNDLCLICVWEQGVPDDPTVGLCLGS